MDTVPEELWMKVHNTVQEVLNKTISKKKKCKNAKWLSEETLQIAEERREAKSKGERERYTQLIAEFQRRARRDKNFFLNEQCKEIEQSNRMGKTRDLFWRRKWQPTPVFLPGEPHRRQPTRFRPSLGFSRQEHWSGLPFPSPMHESEK